MWLLNTARAELKFFPTPESVPGGYAILSHVWGEDEQTFQDVQAICARCAEDGTNPRDRVCDKIRQFCILSERSGYDWGWADMCCIDKTSSTELSEAITAMYRYYSLADVCYVYLRDVATAKEDALRAPDSEFRKSRWHKRGWTLQELIAPPFVVFLSNTWDLLGAKVDLADLLREITRIPEAVLKLKKRLSDHCVAVRMSWAADRETTRPEDEAYCLMGIFGIFMPPLYGEGRNAFLRLQEEIMRQVDDSSIFAWGPIDLRPYEELSKKDRLTQVEREELEMTSLFAHSPSDFKQVDRIHGRTKRPFRTRILKNLGIATSRGNLSKLSTFTVTPHGIMAHLPVLNLKVSNILLALLCGIEMEESKRNLALILREVLSPDDTRPLYVPCTLSLSRARLMVLEEDFQQIREKWGTMPEWRTIYIVRNRVSPLELMDLVVVSRFQMVCGSLRTPFYFPRSTITKFLGHEGISSWSLFPLDPDDLSWWQHVALKVYLSTPKSDPWIIVAIYFGLCTKASSDRPQHWAKIVEYSLAPEEYEPQWDVDHICAEHHVDKCPRQTHSLTKNWMSSSLLGRSLELSFEPFPLFSTSCRKVNINFN